MVDVEKESDSGLEEEEMSSEGSGKDQEEHSSGDEQEQLSSEAEGEEDEEEDEVDNKEEEDEEKAIPEQLSGWADSIAKILKSTKPKNKKELILSRARKDYEVSKAAREIRKQPLDNLEIIPSSTQKSTSKDEEEKPPVKKEKNDNILSLKVQRKLELKQKKLELAWENLARLNVEKTDPQLEKDLAKMATKGVVQLFNAISMQQKTIKTKLRTSKQSEFEKDKILNKTKDVFDDAMSRSKRLAKNSEVEIKEESSNDEEKQAGGASVSIKIKRKSSTSSGSSAKRKPAWNAIQDNFMLNAKLKDWDKGSDSE